MPHARSFEVPSRHEKLMARFGYDTRTHPRLQVPSLSSTNVAHLPARHSGNEGVVQGQSAALRGGREVRDGTPGLDGAGVTYERVVLPSGEVVQRRSLHAAVPCCGVTTRGRSIEAQPEVGATPPRNDTRDLVAVASFSPLVESQINPLGGVRVGPAHPTTEWQPPTSSTGPTRHCQRHEGQGTVRLLGVASPSQPSIEDFGDAEELL